MRSYHIRRSAVKTQLQTSCLFHPLMREQLVSSTLIPIIPIMREDLCQFVRPKKIFHWEVLKLTNSELFFRVVFLYLLLTGLSRITLSCT